MHTVASMKWQMCFRQLTMRKVVEESRPVEMESMSSTLAGPTTISPAEGERGKGMGERAKGGILPEAEE